MLKKKQNIHESFYRAITFYAGSFIIYSININCYKTLTKLLAEFDSDLFHGVI